MLSLSHTARTSLIRSLYTGDIRSRLIRLIPPSPPSSPLFRIRNLLAYRLPSSCSDRQARDEWREIVEGRSTLWEGIPGDRKEMIRGMSSSQHTSSWLLSL